MGVLEDFPIPVPEQRQHAKDEQRWVGHEHLGADRPVVVVREACHDNSVVVDGIELMEVDCVIWKGAQLDVATEHGQDVERHESDCRAPKPPVGPQAALPGYSERLVPQRVLARRQQVESHEEHGSQAECPGEPLQPNWIDGRLCLMVHMGLEPVNEPEHEHHGEERERELLAEAQAPRVAPAAQERLERRTGRRGGGPQGEDLEEAVEERRVGVRLQRVVAREPDEARLEPGRAVLRIGGRVYHRGRDGGPVPRHERVWQQSREHPQEGYHYQREAQRRSQPRCPLPLRCPLQHRRPPARGCLAHPRASSGGPACQHALHEDGPEQDREARAQPEDPQPDADEDRPKVRGDAGAPQDAAREDRPGHLGADPRRGAGARGEHGEPAHLGALGDGGAGLREQEPRGRQRQSPDGRAEVEGGCEAHDVDLAETCAAGYAVARLAGHVVHLEEGLPPRDAQSEAEDRPQDNVQDGRVDVASGAGLPRLLAFGPAHVENRR
mmetsp:Transcript_62575/g.177801  ORF Transcript_62575/g.177801 Transcript_62575/m.177801 type:complete len:497 (+) Transcript_62575:884-2374(+)